jgi:hypothetical protein
MICGTAAGRWFSLGILVSFTIKTDRHDKTEILLKVALTKQTGVHSGAESSKL